MPRDPGLGECATRLRALATGIGCGPAAGPAVLGPLERSGALAGYHLLPATRADLLRRAGRTAAAATAYRQALRLAVTDAERRYLTRRLAEVAADPGGT